MTYVIGLGFAGLIAVSIWFMPDESLLGLFEKTQSFTEKTYRINWTIEILIAYLLISIYYWKVIYRPIKNISII